MPIGWDREREERSAGLRTFPLVATSSCGFIQASEGVIDGDTEAIARIIAGMGFIGGGTILKLKTSVHGTATAASLWATGAVGTAAGLGAYDVAALLSVMVFFTPRALKPLKKDLTREDNKSPSAIRPKS